MRFSLRPADGPPVVVDGERIGEPGDGVGFALDLGPGELLPGLINAHDHLHLNHFPRLGLPPYRNTGEWERDVHGRFADAVARASRLPRREAFLFGALKNLLGGVTTVVHHDPWDARLDGDFPVRVCRVRVAHSFRFERDLAAAVAGDGMTRGRPLSMHLAEGTDRESADEVRRAEAEGLLDERFLAVHLVGIDADGVARMGRAGAAAVWCPTSNLFLFGRTAPRELFGGGLDVLLGTDALFTAEGTMLDELRRAREVGYLDEGRLRGAVGEVAARRLGLQVPSLVPGALADIVFLRRPVVDARSADVGLVLVGGVPRLADPEFGELFARCGVRAEEVRVGEGVKLVAARLGTAAARAVELVPECGRVLG